MAHEFPAGASWPAAVTTYRHASTPQNLPLFIAPLASRRRIDVAQFAANGNGSGPSPLLRPAPSHAAQHLLLDATLALPAGAAGAAGAAAKPQPTSSSGSKDSGGSQGDGAAPVLGTVGEMLEAALLAAGLPVQRRQAGSFPSFRHRPSQLDAGAEQAQGRGGGEDEEGGHPDLLFFSCRLVQRDGVWLGRRL